jgi:hypothetical protein
MRHVHNGWALSVTNQMLAVDLAIVYSGGSEDAMAANPQNQECRVQESGRRTAGAPLHQRIIAAGARPRVFEHLSTACG